MLIPRRETIVKVHDHIIARSGGESGTLHPNLLQAAIDRPKTTIIAKGVYEPYKGLLAKTVALGYALISWHPFIDGNKRTAINIMKLMLNANGVQMLLPPYIIKYSVQIVLPHDTNRRIEEEEFLERIAPLCYPSGNSAFWKTLRYWTYPRVLLQGYFFLLRKFPDSRYINRQLEQKIFDWYCAKDRATMESTIREWRLRTDQGYPKKTPILNISSDDFDNFPD